MNELTITEMHATVGGTSSEGLPLSELLPTWAPSARLLESLATLAAQQQQAGLLLLQRLSD